MREPVLVEFAQFTPGHCHICGTNDGEMIDTMVDVPGDGRTYVCVRTCLPMIAGLAGYLPPDKADELAGKLAAAAEQVAKLEAELEFERGNKLMTVSDALALADRADKPIDKVPTWVMQPTKQEVS